MPTIRPFAKSTLTLIIALLISGCTALKPVQLPDETTPMASNEPFWQALEPELKEDWFVLLNRGTNALDWRLKAIDSATQSIEIQTFLWSMDTVGSLVIEHLIAAADRGVHVRILVDDSFLMGEEQPMLYVHEHENISFRIFNPFKRRSDNAIARQALNLAEFHRLDHRMHNKSMVIDNRVAIVGGRNLADEYFGLHTEANFRDLEVLLGGSMVLTISQAFDGYWNDDWSFPIDQISHVESVPATLNQAALIAHQNTGLHQELTRAELQANWATALESAYPGESRLLVDTPPEDNPANTDQAPVQVANALMDELARADNEIIIISAYLIPTPELESAVQEAVQRGVRVKILTNSIGSNNHLSAHSAYRNHINTLLGHGADLFEVRIDADDRSWYMLTPVEQKELALHAKALIIDDNKVFIGSANLDPRSLRINTEMGLVINSPQLNQALRQAVERDFDGKNAWNLKLTDDGSVNWASSDGTLTAAPARSSLQRLEDWFLSHLPIENEM